MFWLLLGVDALVCGLLIGPLYGAVSLVEGVAEQGRASLGRDLGAFAASFALGALCGVGLQETLYPDVAGQTRTLYLAVVVALPPVVVCLTRLRTRSAEWRIGLVLATTVALALLGWIFAPLTLVGRLDLAVRTLVMGGAVSLTLLLIGEATDELCAPGPDRTAEQEVA